MTALAIQPRIDTFAAERRRHSRVRVRLTGQFMRENREEFPCSTIDVSIGGIAFSALQSVEIGEKIIAYVAEIGRVQGAVRRLYPDGFAIAMSLPPLKREKLADQLTWIANRQDLGMSEDRIHERIQLHNPHCTLTLADGREMMCKIIDISRSGAAASVSASLPIGALVAIGRTRGRVVRQFTGGVAIEFVRIIPPDEFDADYRL